MPYTRAITINLPTTGLTLKGAFCDTAGTMDATLRDIAATEIGSGVYRFVSASFPDDARGSIVFYTGTLAAAVDFAGVTVRAAGAINDKTGYKLASDGLDAISTAAPNGVAANFREMLVQTWRRFFKRSVYNGETLKTFSDDGSTVITTQAMNRSGRTETQGAAS